MPQEKRTSTKMSRWWVHAIILGKPSVLEVTHLNGGSIVDSDDCPSPNLEDRLTVDRALSMSIAPAPQSGMVMYRYTDIRLSLGPAWLPNMPQPDSTRDPLSFVFRSLTGGPWLWVDLRNPANQHLADIVREAYTPADQRIVVPPPGTSVPPVPDMGTIRSALDAMNAMGRKNS